MLRLPPQAIWRQTVGHQHPSSDCDGPMVIVLIPAVWSGRFLNGLLLWRAECAEPPFWHRAAQQNSLVEAAFVTTASRRARLAALASTMMFLRMPQTHT